MSHSKANFTERISRASTETDLDCKINFALHCGVCVSSVARPEENLELFTSPDTQQIEDLNKALQSCLSELDRQIPTFFSTPPASSRPVARLDISSNPLFLKKQALSSNNQTL